MTPINTENLPLWVQNRDTVLNSNQNVQWRYGKQPDYTRSNEKLAQQSTQNHPENSLEALVQNLVRTFDVEANFKTNPQEWISVVQEQFRMSTNGGTQYKLEDLVESGTYKLLIGNTQHYKASEENFETSTNLFHSAFPEGFLWEVVEVYSPPPTIAVKWRHWGHFRGAYKDYAPTGEMIEVIGISIVKVSEDLKILSLEHYYDNTKFLDQLTSGGKRSMTNQQKASGNLQTSNSLSQKFLGFIQRFLGGSNYSKTTNDSVSRCPFAALLR
ncbi:MAG: ester cyclase [Cyanobacteriota bacterium]|nr:ester cyclase [Cyanobacteriota bacterium]